MTKKSLFLLNSFNSTELKNIIKNPNEQKIFPLTFSAVKKLQNLKIPYESTDYLTGTDHQKIDEFAMHIAEQWWDEDNLRTLLEFKKINIAPVIKTEFYLALIKILHRILLVKKIIENNDFDVIYTSYSNNTLDKIPQFVCKTSNLTPVLLNYHSNEILFRYEQYRIKLDLFGKSIDMKIPRNLFSTFKNLYENFWYFRYKFSKHMSYKQQYEKKILFLEFNLNTFNSLITALNNLNHSLNFINLRRPLIWNISSLNLSKKLSLRRIKLSSNNSQKQYEQTVEKILQFIQNSDIFHQKFVIDSINFWDLIENDLITFFKSRFLELFPLISNTFDIFQKEDFDLILCWDDSQFFERTILSLSKLHNIPSLQLQHGIISYVNHENRIWFTLQLRDIITDKYALYGNTTHKTFLDNGADKEKLVITGCPRYDELFNYPKSNKKNQILFLTSGIPTSYSYFNSVDVILHYEELVTTIFKKLHTFTDKNIVIKRHPSQDEIIDIKQIASELLPNAKIISNANTYELISNSDVIISPPSTAITEAIALDKPVLLIKYMPFDYSSPYQKTHSVLPISSINDVDEAINQILFDPHTRSVLAKGRQQFLKEVLSYPGKSVNQVLKVINDMFQNNA